MPSSVKAALAAIGLLAAAVSTPYVARQIVVITPPPVLPPPPINAYWVSPTGAALWANCKSTQPISGVSACALTTAITSVVAGDTVFLRGGSYNAGILLNAKSGTIGSRITFAAYPGETPEIRNTTNVIFAGRFHGLYLFGSNYVVIRGIDFYHTTGGYFVQLTNGATYNEIDDALFDGGGVNSAVDVWKGNSALDDTFAAIHNWIHNSTFRNIGQVSGDPVNDLGGMQIGIVATPYDQVSGNNTLENNVFACGGHHLIETFSKYNVIRNNFFRNEGCMANGGPGTPTYGPDSNGQWGNRNVQIYDGVGNDGMFNLIEGNRFGPSGPPPDDDGGDGFTLTAPKNIVRYNEIYGSHNNGLLMKIGSLAESDNNRVYNNTIFGFARFDNTGPQWQGFGLRFYPTTPTSAGNVLKNNIIYSATSVTDISHAAQDGGTINKNTLMNNWCTSEALAGHAAACLGFGDPLFTSSTINIFPATTTAPDLTLQAGSGAVNTGVHLTTTVGAGSSATTLVVADALYFQDATWGSDLARGRSLLRDWIAIGTVTNTVQIASVNYATNTITLASAASWANGASVWLYKKSDGAVVLVGAAPDIGAKERP